MDETARTDTPRTGTSWSTRRKVLIVIGAVALASGAFVAGSGGELGVLTGGSDDGTGSSDADGDWQRAAIVAVDDDGGVEARVEVAPVLDGSGRCVRVSLAGEAGRARCGGDHLNAWDDPTFELRRIEQYFGSVTEHAARVDDRWVVALSGAVHPDVVRVTAHFGDGSQYSFVTRNAGGWFVAVLPDDVADPAVDDGRLVNVPMRLELFDVSGTRVASVDLSSVGTAA